MGGTLQMAESLSFSVLPSFVTGHHLHLEAVICFSYLNPFLRKTGSGSQRAERKWNSAVLIPLTPIFMVTGTCMGSHLWGEHFQWDKEVLITRAGPQSPQRRCSTHSWSGQNDPGSAKYLMNLVVMMFCRVKIVLHWKLWSSMIWTRFFWSKWQNYTGRKWFQELFFNWGPLVCCEYFGTEEKMDSELWLGTPELAVRSFPWKRGMDFWPSRFAWSS